MPNQVATTIAARAPVAIRTRIGKEDFQDFSRTEVGSVATLETTFFSHFDEELLSFFITASSSVLSSSEKSSVYIRSKGPQWLHWAACSVSLVASSIEQSPAARLRKSSSLGHCGPERSKRGPFFTGVSPMRAKRAR